MSYLFLIFCFSNSNVLKAQNGKIDSYEEIIPGTEFGFEMQLVHNTEFEAPNGKKVKLSPYYIGTHEVTHDLLIIFRRKEKDTNESKLMEDYDVDGITRPTPPYENLSWGMGEEGGFPAIGMTQQNALKFCNWLYTKTGRFYRLPTEAEWIAAALEYEPNEGWFAENSDDKYHKTGSLKSEKVLFDMFGNVMEWTLDNWEDEFLMSENESVINDPWSIPTKKNYRVLKGGSFIDSVEDINIWTRIKSDKRWQARDPQIPKSKWWLTDGSFVGFRLVSPVDQPSKEEIEDFFAKAIID